MKNICKFMIAFGAIFFVFIIATPIFAHPGNTAGDGCHYCRTNCDSWGVGWDVRHCHNTTILPPKDKYTTNEVTREELVPFSSSEEGDPSLEKDKTTIKQKGVDGIKTITVKITYKNGIEIDREEISKEITTKPVQEIILIGTKEAKKGKVLGVGAEENNNTEATWLWLILIGFIGVLIYSFYIKKTSK